MPGPRPKPIHLTVREHKILKQIISKDTMPQALVRRAKIILNAADGLNNTEISNLLELSHPTVRLWRNRWLTACDKMQAIQGQNGEDKELTSFICQELLKDSTRSGAPHKFTAEQVTQIIALACQSPEEHGCPVSHWTPKELVIKVIEKEIVESISQRTVGRILEDADLKPSRTRYWLNPEIEDQEAFERSAQEICQLYSQAKKN